jgi:copper chaperone CopZ
MNTININTTGLHCASCGMLIEMSVADLPGIAEVKTPKGDGVTTVTYDPSKIDADAIVQEIRKAGYGAEIQA